MDKQKPLATQENYDQECVDGLKKHVQSQSALISLPVEKMTEKKAKKGKPNVREFHVRIVK